MTTESASRRSRRAVLTSAVGGAAALAAARLAAPSSTMAATGGNMIIGQTNNATSQTTLDAGGANALYVASAGDWSILTTNTHYPGVGVNAQSSGIAVQGREGNGQFDPYLNGPGTAHIALYGFSGNTGGIGVHGQTAVNGGTIGVFGSGDQGGKFVGTAAGAVAWGYDDPGGLGDAPGTGLHAHVSTSADPPASPTGTAIFASVDNRATRYGLQVQGKVRLIDRSGRATITAGHYAVTRYISGVTSSNIAVATLNTLRTGIWVRAVVCATGKITIYLNAKVSGATSVSWIVLG